MIYSILIIIGFLLLLIIGLWFAWNFYKKKIIKTMAEKIVPNELLEEFNKAESLLKGGLNKDGTTTNPYKILWEISRKHRQQGGADREINVTEHTTSDRELSEQLNRRQDIQDRIATDIIKDESTVRKSNKNNIRGIINRIRARN